MITLVTFTEAERHLNLDCEGSNKDRTLDLQMKLLEASEIVFDYLKITIPERTSPVEESPTYSFWASVPAAIPFNVKAATLLVLGELWLNREATAADVLSDTVKSLLHRKRDPALA